VQTVSSLYIHEHTVLKTAKTRATQQRRYIDCSPRITKQTDTTYTAWLGRRYLECFGLSKQKTCYGIYRRLARIGGTDANTKTFGYRTNDNNTGITIRDVIITSVVMLCYRNGVEHGDLRGPEHIVTSLYYL